MKESVSLKRAQDIIQNVKGQSLNVDQRKKLAVDLAGCLLDEARQTQTPSEKIIQKQLARMMNDPLGKAFTTSMTDQCFRSNRAPRVANQIIHVLEMYGVPHYLPFFKKAQLKAFQILGNIAPNLLVPLTKNALREQTSSVILPGESDALAKHMQKRQSEGVRINLNHLGEAILGEEEALHRLDIYLNDLSKPEVEYISVKISTICSQLNLLAWEDTLKIPVERLKLLYRTAIKTPYTPPSGKQIPKFVNLDMEEYRDLHLTFDLFRTVLDDPEFYHYSAGIVLQSYLPDSFLIQQELTEWAMQRVKNGGAPIKIRIVKGANLAMEKVEASLRLWEQAPYANKNEVDANFKRMVVYGCRPEHARAAHLGIGSHNLFDIAYAMLIRAENNIEPYVCFEMLEGMADHIRRVVQKLSGDMLLYCPAATKEEFQNAVAYLVRRLDENTAPENFLRFAFELLPGTPLWNKQANMFAKSCEEAESVSSAPRRQQNRFLEPRRSNPFDPFTAEPDTDWSLPQNRKWAENIIHEWSQRKQEPIPLVIDGESIFPGEKSGVGEDPSKPAKELYRYTLATPQHIEKSLSSLKSALVTWSNVGPEERSSLLAETAHKFRKNRSDLIGAMVADTGKTVAEADVEISEAIDFLEYYRRNVEEFALMTDMKFSPKGTILVAPPWNFPCSISTGGIAAALAAGNCVIFKPAPEAVLVAWQLVNLFWEAGIPRNVLQFINCDDDPVGSLLIKDPRVDAIVLTGATSTAKLFLRMRPGIDLIAETGGKNPMIITSMSDRDLAIKDLIQSAFGHSGQKCSACSLAILEAEVYEDKHFLDQLKDAASSLRVGSPWNLATRVNPLIHSPNPTLMRGLTHLDDGEEWLLKPKQDATNPYLWSPGIKLGVKKGSFMHQTELFGPLLGVMRADNLQHAIKLANGTPYGLTSGLQSLDDREQQEWYRSIDAGNCYINRGITGAIVQRQPFGGCKESSFGRGFKAGGPNYVLQMMNTEQVTIPEEQDFGIYEFDKLTEFLADLPISVEEMELWKSSLGSYAYYWGHYFSQEHDPSHLRGQDNLLSYLPQKYIALRIHNHDNLMDAFRVIGAALICGSSLEISAHESIMKQFKNLDILTDHPLITIVTENESAFIDRIRSGECKRVRFVSPPAYPIEQALGDAACSYFAGPVIANGRIELLNYLHEVSLSIDYHRYGNLGMRQGEFDQTIKTEENSQSCSSCTGCGCNG